MKIIGSKVQEWKPRGYQEAGVEHLCGNSSAALFYDPGLGKTSTTLAAFKLLQEHGVAHRALVIAPVRVCQLVWEQEAAQWTQFADLRFANMAAKSKQTRENQLQANADIWLINPESVAWLAQQYQFRELPFDTLIIDELTKFKNSRAGRSQHLQPLANKMARRWGLTGSPAPNGYEDLFGQMKILDGGAALGEYITQYRDRFFTKSHDGFGYELRPGADGLIQERLKPYVHALRAEDYLTLPPLIPHDIHVLLDASVMAQYKSLKKQMVLDLPSGSVTAVNAAALYTKLTQFTGGAVYTGDGAWARVHDGKLDALEDLVEELSGQQLLVAYHYGHELERLLERFAYDSKGNPHKHVAWLGSGVSEKRAKEIEDDWNAGRIKLLFGHPMSMGHGLNFQKSGASHICWFTQTWDFELWDQFIKRVLRQGNTAERVVNHRLVVEGTIDILIGDAVSMKRDDQNALLEALKADFIKDDPDASRLFSTGENEVRKIELPEGTQPTQTVVPEPQQERVQTTAKAAGWGRAPTSDAPKTDVRALVQSEAQLSKVAGPVIQPVAQVAAQGGWGKPFVAPVAGTVVHTAGYAEPISPTPVGDGSFTALAQLQEQVLQPGELQPQFQIQQGGERIDPAQDAPFDGGKPASIPQPRAKRTRKTTAAEQSPAPVAQRTAPSITFDIGSYITQRLATGQVSFAEAQNEAADIVASLES